MDEREALAQQKEQCIFCKIVKGDVPAKKVFEDDKVLAIMDINPARKGHVLILPKEHHPILPLIPFNDMQHLFRQTYHVSKAVKDAMLCKGVSVFIANGGAAGQQSPHFLMHIIPREHEDFFPGTAMPTNADKAANDEVMGQLRQRLRGMMQAYLAQTGRQHLAIAAEPPVLTPATTVEERPSPQETASEEQLDRLITLIDENDDLKDALLYRVDEVKEAIHTNERWQALFKGVDVDKLSHNLRAMAAAQAKRREGGEQ